nr:endo-1,4-beta-xylanase 1-like [Ipomoea batatas]
MEHCMQEGNAAKDEQREQLEKRSILRQALIIVREVKIGYMRKVQTFLGLKRDMEKLSLIDGNNSESSRKNSTDHSGTNIILNHNFSEGMNLWHPNCCEAFVVPADTGSYAVITNRKECWQGLEQNITKRVSTGSTYTVCAFVGVSGAISGCTDVQATLKVEYRDSATSYVFIGRRPVSKDCWEKLGRHIFTLWYTLISEYTPVSSYPFLFNMAVDGKIRPVSGNSFARATERTQIWNGIQQDITGTVLRKLAYEVTAVVRLYGNNVTSADVRATLLVHAADFREEYIGIASVQATDREWTELRGKFLLNGFPSKVVIFLEGPPPGIDILLNSLTVKHAAKVLQSPPPRVESIITREAVRYNPVLQNADFGVNVITNTNLNDGTNGWFPVGNCTLIVRTGSPRIIPPAARDSLGTHLPLSGRYILVTNRTHTWMGPAQMITDKVKLYLTYQVSAWVRIGKATGAQTVNLALDVDSQWVNGGHVEINDDRWHEISGSFRIEKEPAKIMVYIQGPAPGVDLMVAALQVFPVDRKARFEHLRRETDKIRKRDVILKFSGSDSLHGADVRVRQTQNSFPFGSCISRGNIDNEDFTEFFVKNFNWAVFGNELKWYSTEPEQGKLNYKDADELLEFCTRNNIQVRVVIVSSGRPAHTVQGKDQTVRFWFTEIDFSSTNEYIRADDLEVMLRECFAHPAVEGIMLWGFWELFMSRENSHLVNAEGDLNEAGRRYLALKDEWLSHSHGHIDAQGHFSFRGFHGSYELEIIGMPKRFTRTFVVEKGDDPLVIPIDL